MKDDKGLAGSPGGALFLVLGSLFFVLGFWFLVLFFRTQGADKRGWRS